MRRPVAICGVGAVGPWGLGRRGIPAPAAAPSRQLAASHPGTLGFEVPELSPEQDAGDRRQRKLMSRGAQLGAVAMREALREAGWDQGREAIGAYLGVGASGAHMEEIPAALEASLADGAFSQRAFGEKGILACNPLFVFQLMNNFTLCHGAILEGLGGPDGAFHSRGLGTLQALEEAVGALEDGACARVLAGGADSAHHPVTWAELTREGRVAEGLVPGEGAAVLALALEAERPAAWLVDWGTGFGDLAPAEVVVAGWSPAVTEALAREASSRWPAPVVRWAAGEALAAGPALAWALGLDRLRVDAMSVLVLSRGLDGELVRVFLRWAP